MTQTSITFTKIKLKNFMSFSNQWTEVELDVPGTTLIIGENLDSGASSGAGKSTLINAISYCLYDKIPSNVSKDRLINRVNDKKNTTMEVELTFTKGVDTYIVRRWRGSSTGIQLLINGLDATPASVNRGEDSFNSKVEELVEVSYSLFSQIILFNGSSMAFLDLSVGAQRTLIEELFKITTLSRKAVALKKIISEADKSIALQKLLLEQQKKQNELHRTHVEQSKARVQQWEISRTIELEKIQAQLESSSNIDFQAEEEVLVEVTAMLKQITNLQSKIKELKLANESELREAQARKDSELKILAEKRRSRLGQTFSKAVEINSLTKELTYQKSNLSKFTKELAHLKEAKCPYCLQQFTEAKQKLMVLENQESVTKTEISLLDMKLQDLHKEELTFNSQVEAEINVIDAELSTCELIVLEESSTVVIRTQEINSTQVNLTKLQAQLSEVNSLLTFKDLGALLRARGEISRLHDRLEAMLLETNPHLDAYETSLQDGEIKEDGESLEALITIQEHQQFLLKLLTDKNSFIRKNIISRTIPFLNKQIATYTEKLNLPHVVSFKPDMTCEITEIGRELDHGNLSNGEKKKLNLSLCLAFRDVLTYLQSRMNVLFTDEIDSGTISGSDLEALIQVIKDKATTDEISIFIVSHRPEFEGRCSRNIVITKENGFSAITEVY